MNIWVPKVKIIEPREAVSFASEIQGFYRVQIKKSNGRIRQDTGWFPNLITNVGLNKKGTAFASSAYCAVGTGNAAPNVLDTGLANEIARTTQFTSGSYGAETTPPYYGRVTYTFNFGLGNVVGNIAEIGLFDSSTPQSGDMWSRALITDELGNPTTITLLADEQLIVTYQCRCYPPNVDPAGNSTDTLGQVDIGGVTYDIAWRAANVTGSWWQQPQVAAGITSFSSAYAYETDVLGDITVNPSGAQSTNGTGNGSSAPYVDNSYEREVTANFAINAGNFATGIGSVVFVLGSADINSRAAGRIQVSFSPKIPKNADKIMSLTWVYSWSRRIL